MESVGGALQNSAYTIAVDNVVVAVAMLPHHAQRTTVAVLLHVFIYFSEKITQLGK